MDPIIGIEIIVNTILSTISAIGFYYIYKKTHYSIFLIGGTLSYMELLFRTIADNIHVTQFLNLFYIPELLVISYILYIIYKDKNWYIFISLLVFGVIYILLTYIGHKFYGDVGVVVMLLSIIWMQQSKRPCDVNPFNQGKHCLKRG